MMREKNRHQVQNFINEARSSASKVLEHRYGNEGSAFKRTQFSSVNPGGMQTRQSGFTTAAGSQQPSVS